MKEFWKDIPEYFGDYMISDLGRVKSFKYGTHRELKICYDKDGYGQVALHNRSGKGITKKVHQLVAITFLNHRPNGLKGLVVDHINNIKTDNRVCNLQLVSQRENVTKNVIGLTSSFSGVYWNRQCNKWHSRIYINKQRVHLGYFNNELDASKAYQEAKNNINA